MFYPYITEFCFFIYFLACFLCICIYQKLVREVVSRFHHRVRRSFVTITENQRKRKRGVCTQWFVCVTYTNCKKWYVHFKFPSKIFHRLLMHFFNQYPYFSYSYTSKYISLSFIRRRKQSLYIPRFFLTLFTVK